MSTKYTLTWQYYVDEIQVDPYIYGRAYGIVGLAARAYTTWCTIRTCEPVVIGIGVEHNQIDNDIDFIINTTQNCYVAIGKCIPDTWYDMTLHIWVDSAGYSENCQLYIDENLVYEGTGTARKIKPIVAFLEHWAVSGGNIYLPVTVDLSVRVDNVYYYVNDVLKNSDTFSDGDLSNWQIWCKEPEDETLDWEESGVYKAIISTYTPEIKYIKRGWWLEEEVPSARPNDMTTNTETGTLYHAYNDGYGNIYVQIFYPGATSPSSTVLVLTDQGDYWPAITYRHGKLFLCMSDGTTRLESSNPADEDSWQTWTAD